MKHLPQTGVEPRPGHSPQRRIRASERHNTASMLTLGSFLGRTIVGRSRLFRYEKKKTVLRNNEGESRRKGYMARQPEGEN